MKPFVVAALTALASAAAYAGSPVRSLPEPGSFELLAIAGVVAVVVAIRNRRK